MDGRESLYANVKYDILQYNAAVPAPCSGKIQVAERILIYEGHVRSSQLTLGTDCAEVPLPLRKRVAARRL